MSQQYVNLDHLYSEVVNDPKSVGIPESVVEKKCPVCKKLLPPDANLSFHLMLHPWTDKPYSCDHCLYISMSRENLLEHCKTVHPSTRNFLCAVCGKQFANVRSLNKHKPVHAENLPFSCAFCDKGFAEYVNWRQHEVSHKCGKYSCENCSVQFTTVKAYNDHCETGDCKSKVLKCCDQVFSSRMQYVDHCYEHHRVQRREEFSCDICQRIFAFKFHLNVHRVHCKQRYGKGNLLDTKGKVIKSESNFNSLAEHNSTAESDIQATLIPVSSDTENQVPQVYKCEFCNKTFNNRNWLMQHRRVHQDPKLTTCQFCNKKYASYSALYYHKQSVHMNVKRHKCSYCDKAFASGQALRDHVTSHTGEQPYACNYCPKRFRHRGSKIEHLRIHTGERPFKCNFCDLSFKRRNAKKSHERCHTGEKPYKCRLCDRCFAQDSTWRSHEKTHKAPFSCTLCNLIFGSKDDFINHRTEHGETVLEEVTYITDQNQPVEMSTDAEGNVYIQYQVA